MSGIDLHTSAGSVKGAITYLTKENEVKTTIAIALTFFLSLSSHLVIAQSQSGRQAVSPSASFSSTVQSNEEEIKKDFKEPSEGAAREIGLYR